jgi:hypothetical protein
MSIDFRVPKIILKTMQPMFPLLNGFLKGFENDIFCYLFSKYTSI